MQKEGTQSLSHSITTLYCVCDDFLKAVGWQDDPQAQMTTAEVMTVALVAAAVFRGNQEISRLFLREHGYITPMLSKSRLNRRLHKVPEVLWQQLLWVLAQATAACNPEGVYVADSCPVPACDNIRISRCHLYQDEQFRGYCASKRRYYYGLKLHLVLSATGQPVEVLLSPASVADIEGLRRLPLDLPEQATLMADAAYTDYEYEDGLQQAQGTELKAQRRANSKRPHAPWEAYLIDTYRKTIESVFSVITEWMGRRIHAVTSKGFELKVFLTVLAYAILA